MSARRHLFLARAIILLAAMSLAASVIRSSGSTVMERAKPALAVVLMPENARAALAAARAELRRDAKPENRHVQALVKAAVARDTTLPGTLEIMAMAAADRGDHQGEARLFALSDRISRRSLTTRLWFIQHAVEQQDADGALRNFDIALRTSSEAPARLFPILLRASTDPQLVRKVAQLADRSRSWRELLLDYAGERGNPAGAALLLLNMRSREAIDQAAVVPKLTVRLIDNGQFDLARRMHERFASRADGRALVADPQFADEKASFPFGWALNQSGGVSIYRVTEEGRTGLAYSAETGRGGQAATQALFLSPGRFRLTSRLSSIADRDTLPYWLLTCAGSKEAPLLRMDVPAKPGATLFNVPPSCPVQWLSLHLRARFEAGGQSGEIASVRIEPVQAK